MSNNDENIVDCTIIPSDFFKDFIDTGLKNEGSFSLYDDYDNEVTKKFIDDIKLLHIDNNYEKILQIITENNLTPAYTEREISPYQKRAQDISISHSKVFRKTGKAGGFTREWSVRLGGSFMYNPNTGKIGTVAGPTLVLEYTSFPMSTSAYLANVSPNFIKYIPPYKN